MTKARTRRPTLMVVHAHPDDESSQTGGTLARYAAAGCHTVLVTCTDGGRGDSTPADGMSGAHNSRSSQVAAIRSAELAVATAALGVDEVIELGHPDSGIPEDPATIASEAFSRMDPEPVVTQLTALMHEYRPDVVITYPPNGLSFHPDHIQVHRVTVEAFRQYLATPPGTATATSGAGPKLYFIAVSRTRLQAVRTRGKSLLPAGSWIPPLEIAIDDAAVTTVIDVSEVWSRKIAALAAHESQADAAALHALFSVATSDEQMEEFVLAVPGGARTVVENDLFAGIPGH
ncbi:PIG-L family deacetylase [Streptomyces krungchingensis]|uniref:PIG-L family deacetylase n=1 Tax=Streptomyces krungchingensis TaxID=1565034 RepID=UPI003CFB57A7